MLFKNTFRKVKKSFGRYLSLFMIVLVGIGFYAGIQATAPDIIMAADHYYKDHNLMDYKIVSSMGLTEEDVTALKELKQSDKVIPSYSIDVLAGDKVIRVHAIEKAINTVKLMNGRMPQNEKECLADDKTYQIGDLIKITSDVSKKLKNKEFKVVGTVDSVLYLADDYGNTNIGDGKLSSFIFVDKTNFISEVYTEIYMTASQTVDSTAYSEVYDNAASKLEDELLKIKPDREEARYQEIYQKANKEINNNERKLTKEKEKGERKLSDAKAELDDNSQKIKDAKVELTKKEVELEKNIEKQNAEFKSAKTKITQGWGKINSALTQYGIKQEDINQKIVELGTAIETMKTQLNALPTNSEEYNKLHINIIQYSESYKGLLKVKETVNTLTTKEAELNNGMNTFRTEINKAKRKIQEGKKKIAVNEDKKSDGFDKYNKNLDKFNIEIAEAQTKMYNAKKDLADINRPQWFLFDRDAAIGYSDLKSGIDVITSVASVFPLFFILIGMLMTSNSMARMIAEERSELGTLASLGYRDKNIIATYLLYVLTASGLGAFIGFFIGCFVIPPLIYINFKFILPPLVIEYNMATFFMILLITFLLMTSVTMIACNKELKQKPAALMRPVPPGNGKTILLEKIRPVWKHLSFTWKVTMRNLFRYKKRAIMTIIGISGCTSLLLVGFGLKDSMNGVAQKQYQEIFQYDDMIILKDETGNIGKDLKNLLDQEQIQDPLLIKQTSLKCESKKKSLNAFLIVPKNQDIFNKYYKLISKINGETQNINSNGVIITQKLAEVFKLGQGDILTVKDADNKEYRLTVQDVVQNYTANYIYMSDSSYHQIFGKSPAYNVIVSNHNHTDEKVLAEHLIDSGFVLNVVFTSDVLQKAIDSTKRLNGIIILIVVVALLLAIIVLYNLTSINISEREREIATLKVLGFTDGETNGYIYREAFILTLISIGVGLILGIYLHRYVIDVIEGYASLFIKIIRWPSFIIASVITVLFSVIMQIVTYYKLRKIDMIESLKSVE